MFTLRKDIFTFPCLMFSSTFAFELFWASNEIMHLNDLFVTIKFIANNLNYQSLLLAPHFSFVTSTDDILSKLTLYGGWGLIIAWLFLWYKNKSEKFSTLESYCSNQNIDVMCLSWFSFYSIGRKISKLKELFHILKYETKREPFVRRNYLYPFKSNPWLFSWTHFKMKQGTERTNFT